MTDTMCGPDQVVAPPAGTGGRGHQGQSLAAGLFRLADATSDRRLAVLAARIEAPLRVTVDGRPGVGRRTVASALSRAGVAVGDADADVAVRVVAEVCKPEDAAAVAGATRPVLVVLNKADLPGGADAAEVARRLGVPVQAMSGLLALAEPVEHPAAALRRRSGLDRVLVRLAQLGAGARYRRLTETMTRLAALAVENPRVGELLLADESVAVCAAAAEAVVAGLGLDAGDELSAARYWARHRAAPLSALHRSCAADITRGSLRRWQRARESA